ncbi:MAG: S8 family serine peptidase [Kiritimatiellae bacterium]|nr:S8 family serine peptidase [Kiritimatiellia bacterium]
MNLGHRQWSCPAGCAERAVRRAGLAVWVAAVGLPAAEVSLRGDRLSIRAEDEPLSAVLGELARLGVRVWMDPAADRRVHVALPDREVDAALRAVIAPLDSMVSWSVVPGPAGGFRQLSEIRVFAPGRADRARPIEPPPRRLELSRGADGRGPLHVDREVLVSVRAGTSPSEFLRFLSVWDASLVGWAPGGVYRLRLPRGADALAVADRMRADPIVRAAEANYAIRLPPPSMPGGSAAAAAGAPAVGAVSAVGSVAVLDTGLSLPPGWTIALAGAWDAVRPGEPVQDPVGHGTQMALVASGAVAPDMAAPVGATPVLAIRTFDDEGVTSNFDLLRAIAFASESGASVISMSWGTETPSEFLRTAVAEAQGRGLLVVAAAGNEPVGRPYYPAGYPGVIAVAAAMPDGRPWEKSNHGDFVVVAAPATAQFPIGYEGPAGRYAGTSTATAYTAAVLAQWLARNPGATPAQASEALTRALSDAGEPGRDPHYGYGLLDAAAVSRLFATPPR